MDEGKAGYIAESFADEVAGRFGVLPNFFCTASAAAGLTEELWAFVKSAYLDSPLPSLFKERLFVHLSRFCKVRYCIVRHVGFLIGKGRPAGDKDAVPETIAQALSLISRPILNAAALSRALARLEAHAQPADIPAPRTQAEADLIDALTIMFVAPARSERARRALRAAVGAARFEVLTAFLAFVRTAHYWTEMHPELAYEPDMIAVMEQHGEFARRLLDPTEAELIGNGEALRNALRELQKTERSLADKSTRLQAIFDGTYECISVLSPDGTLLEANRASLEFAQSTRKEVVGRPFWEMAWISNTPGAAEKLRKEIKRASAGEFVRYDVRLARSSGDVVLDFSLHPIAGRDVKPILIVAEGRNITELKQAEARIRESEERLRLANQELERRVREEVAAREAAQARLAQALRLEALGKLARGVAHDFNNVMQVVQSGIALIERRPAETEEVRDLAHRIMQACERGAAVTRRLLAFARRDRLRAEPVDVSALLGGMQEFLSHTLGAGITVRLKIEPDLPRLLVDKGQLETVLVNLATNARDAMTGTGTLIFGARAETVRDSDAVSRPVTLIPGTYVLLSVSDTGSGMTAAVLEHASEPFFTTKEAEQGTGLGLAIARGFCEQSGGGLRIESALGRGTMVKLWLPIAQEPLVAAAQGTDKVPAPTPGGVHERLFLIDDDISVRELLAQELEAEGYIVLRAASGAEALARLEAGEAVDLIISDLSMPDMDGVSLIRKVRRRRPRLPAILLTGCTTTDSSLLKPVAGGAPTLVQKPIPGRMLAEIVAASLKRKRRGRHASPRPEVDGARAVFPRKHAAAKIPAARSG